MNIKVNVIIVIMLMGCIIVSMRPIKVETKIIREDDKTEMKPKTIVNQLMNRIKGTEFKLVGIVHSESDMDDSIYELYKKQSPIQRNRYLYKVRDKDTGLMLKLNEGKPMDELYTGDLVSILGKESVGDFLVFIE